MQQLILSFQTFRSDVNLKLSAARAMLFFTFATLGLLLLNVPDYLLKKKQITVSWKNNIKNVTCYEIQYSTSKKFTKKTTKTVTAKGKKVKSKKISKLKSKLTSERNV